MTKSQSEKSIRFLDRLFARLHVLSVRDQLTLGIAIALVPTLGIGFVVLNQVVFSRVYKSVERRLQAESELISYGLREWGIGVSYSLNYLSQAPALRQGNIDEIQKIFNRLNVSEPGRFWRFWSASSEAPELLAHTASIRSKQKIAAEANQLNRYYFQAALRGYPTYQSVLSRTTDQGCLNVSKPVFKYGTVQKNSVVITSAQDLIDHTSVLSVPVRTDLAGILVMCIPLDKLAEDTGLDELFSDQRFELLAGQTQQNDFLNDPSGVESALILVSNTGQLLFPGDKASSYSIPNIDDIKSSKYASLYPVISSAMEGTKSYRRIDIADDRYFVLTNKVDSAWSIVLLLNENRPLTAIRQLGLLFVLIGVISILLAVFIVRSMACAISSPISLAANALHRISDGDFDLELPDGGNDEMGGLVHDIQSAANRLKRFLAQATSFAVTEKQLETAKAIQADFLLTDLPNSSLYEVEAYSRPALTIGADWYDMVKVGQYVFIVVADVCDKGVPSALYMSVFRSLIRSKLIDLSSRLDDHETLNSIPDPQADQIASECIRLAIEQTNQYMALNQNSSMMFATVFIAAINTSTGYVSYISAGHEPPLIIGTSELSKLDSMGGPAIGLFDSAQYSVSTLQLQPRDSLVIYSDGLVDARGTSEEGWGCERLQQLLIRFSDESASTLMSTILSAVDQYKGQQEQFDDLTVMVWKWLGP